MNTEEMKVNAQVKAEEAGQPKRHPIFDQVANAQGEELITLLESVHKSDAYVLIRDHVTDLQKRAIIKDKELKERFKALQKDAKVSWDYDHKMASMMDVNRAVTNVYILVLNMIKSINDGQTDTKNAINKLEEHLGIEQTVWVSSEDAKE